MLETTLLTALGGLAFGRYRGERTPFLRKSALRSGGTEDVVDHVLSSTV